jgi:hypothetical protein
MGEGASRSRRARKRRAALALIAAASSAAVGGAPARAQDAPSTGTLEIASAEPVSLIAFPWSPGVSSGVTYGVTTTSTVARITARLDAEMPPGTSLSAALAPPPGAVGLGGVNLTTAPQTVVSKIGEGSFFDLPLTYTFTASGPVDPFARTVTFSLVTGP